MTASTHGTIVPITLTVNGRTGLTLWAPPWEDEDGEDWQGFLGEGSAILLFPSTAALAGYVATGVETDLSDHPAWPAVRDWDADRFRPAADAGYDLDAVFGQAAGEPDPVTVSALAAVVEMVAEIAECCDDGALKALVGSTPEYVGLVEGEVGYSGRDGRRAWNALGGVVASTWERAITRVERWLEWRGDFSGDELAGLTVWEQVGADPVAITLPPTPAGDGDRDDAVGGTVLTVRGVRPDGEALFAGSDQDVAVFADAGAMAAWCRTATAHELTRLEMWDEVRDADTLPDTAFEPDADHRYDLTAPSTAGAQLLRELLTFCTLREAAGSLVGAVDRATWDEALGQLRGCLRRQD